MLNLIRDNVQSFGVKFIVAIVALVMAFFGVSTYQSQSSNTIVNVDGYEVKLGKYQRSFENAQQEIRQKYQSRAADYIKMVNLQAQIVQQLINGAILLKSAAENGMAVSDKELAAAVYANEQFLTDDRFDAEKYKSILKNMRIDKPAYEKDLHERLLTQKYLQFLSSGILFSKKAVEEEYKRYNTEMSVTAIEFTPELFAAQVNLTDDEVKAYYDNHKSEFQQKTQFAVNYFMLGVEDVQEKILVRQKEIEKYYEKNKASEFTTKETFRTRHILIASPTDRDPEKMASALKKAERIYQQVEKDPSVFAALAKKHSADTGSASKGGDLGWVEVGTFVSEYEEVVAELAPGEISKPFLSAHGYHIVELIGRKPEAVKELAAVQEEIAENIRTGKASRRLKNKVQKLLSVEPAKPFSEMAAAESKKIEQTVLFDDSKDLAEIGYSYQFYQGLKDKNLNDTGDYALPDGKSIMIYQVNKIVDPFIKPLEEVRGQVEYYALSEKKQQAAKEKLLAYGSSLKTRDQLLKLGVELKIAPKSATFKVADNRIDTLGVGNEFKMEVFKMEPNQVKAVFDANRGFLVYLDSKSAGTLADDDKKNLAALENMLRQQKAQIVLNGFINQAREKTEIEYNAALLNALNVQLN